MCDCDLEPPTVFRETKRKARKDHKCNDCRGRIVAGETYTETFGVWDGDARRFKRCADCDEFISWAHTQDDCLCLEVGDVLNSTLESFADRGEQPLLNECRTRIKAIRNKRREPVAA